MTIVKVCWVIQITINHVSNLILIFQHVNVFKVDHLLKNPVCNGSDMANPYKLLAPKYSK